MKVTLIDSMGTDLSIVNAARVSFGKRSEPVRYTVLDDDNPDGFYTVETISDRDAKLIRFLARGCTSGDWQDILDELSDMGGVFDQDAEIESLMYRIKNMPTHWTPFGHTAITLHIKAPIFVARQLGKHQVGMVWNEVSRRYVTDAPEFYVPEVWRKAADNVKQGSSDETIDNEEYGDANEYVKEVVEEDVHRSALHVYEHLLGIGVCPEQARMVLPQSLMTEWYWTGNLYSFANVYIQRTDSHAQKEVQDVAHQIGEIIEPLFPVSWDALTKGV